MIDEVVGSYRIKSKVGQGASGEVYLAEHEIMGRRAAIKMLSPAMGSESFIERVQRAATLAHPGLVKIFDFGTHHGRAYVVMEYLEGELLATRIAEKKRISHADAFGLAHQIAAALAFVHEEGVVHGRLTPRNIVLLPDAFVTGGERAKLLDTGVSRDPASPGAAAVAGECEPYLAPEQLPGGPQARAGQTGIDHRADLYALGCILFEMICGRPPFLTSAGEATAKRLSPPSPRRLEPTLTAAEDALILQLLAPRPDDRPPSAGHVTASIDEILGGRVTSNPAMHASTDSAPVNVSFDSVSLEAPASATEGSDREKARRMKILLIALVLAIAFVAAFVLSGLAT